MKPTLVTRFQISRADLNLDRELSYSEWSEFSKPLMSAPNQNVMQKALADLIEKLRSAKEHEAHAKAVYVPPEPESEEPESESSSDWGEDDT